MASDYLTLGRGRLLFAPFLADGITPGGFMEFGNCPAFNLNVTFEDLPHFDSRSGVREEDANATLSREVGGAITCDDLKPDNMAFYFMGEASTVTQATGTAATYAITGTQQGRTYIIGSTLVNPFGVQGLTSVSVADATPTTYDVGDDYTINAEQGTITIVPGGAIADDTDITVTFDNPARTKRRVVSGNNEIEGSLLFLADNPVGINQNALMPWVKLRPEGDLSFITEEWSEANFNIKGLRQTGKQLLYLESVMPE